VNRRQAAKAVENPVRWGLGDFVWVYIAGVFLGALLGSIGIAIGNENVDHPGALGTGLGLLGQFGGWMLFAYVVARWKGRGSLRQDFGLRLDIADWWALFAGMGVFLVASAFIALPNSWITESQKVVEDLESATGAKLWIMAIFAAIVAPVCEELLFRGLLLRSLRRRMLPVWRSYSPSPTRCSARRSATSYPSRRCSCSARSRATSPRPKGTFPGRSCSMWASTS
jgi:membrane protease YdiL (CAAX protease family)